MKVEPSALVQRHHYATSPFKFKESCSNGSNKPAPLKVWFVVSKNWKKIVCVTPSNKLMMFAFSQFATKPSHTRPDKRQQLFTEAAVAATIQPRWQNQNVYSSKPHQLVCQRYKVHPQNIKQLKEQTSLNCPILCGRLSNNSDRFLFVLLSTIWTHTWKCNTQKGSFWALYHFFSRNIHSAYL